MALYHVYQIVFTPEFTETVNAIGDEAAAQQFPAYGVHLDTVQNGSDGYSPHDFNHYDRIAEVDVDVADDITTMEFEGRALRVGDIVETGGRYQMLGHSGFEEIEVE